MSSNSNRKSSSRKAADRPKKPYPDFPLSPHASGAWQKKICGKVHYFGKWGRVVKGVLTRVDGDGWKEALELYKAQADDLHAGRTPRKTNGDGLTLADLCNRYLTVKLHLLESGELMASTFQDYRASCDRLVAQFGKGRLVDDLASDDFEALRAEISKRWGPVRLGNEITRVKSVFKYGYETGVIDRPVRFGPAFKKPSKSVLRRQRATNGKNLFEAKEVRQLLQAAPRQMSAWVLLGINAALGNADLSNLQLTHLDLDGAWLTYPRRKTGIERRAKLWPETVAALQEAIANRPKAKHKADIGCVFLNGAGGRLVRTTNFSRSDAVTLNFGELVRRLGLRSRGYYGLRHTFRTVSDATRDFPAIRVVMGHADGSIDDVYREGIDDSRLEDVAEHVRAWLFG